MCVEQKRREREGGKRRREEQRENLAIVWHRESIGKEERIKFFKKAITHLAPLDPTYYDVNLKLLVATVRIYTIFCRIDLL